MPSVLDFLAFRQIGYHKSKKYLDGKKTVLDLLEYEAAKPSNNEACEFSGEPRATFLVDFSPNMLRAASTHGDHSVRVTDIETGKCTHVLTGHPRTPWCLAFNPTSNDILASGCLGGEVRIWDLLGGGSEVLHNPSLGAVITSLAFHPSGQVLVFATINCIYFWDWSKPTPFAVTKTNHEYERIRWLRFDPYGKYLYTGIANNTTLHGERARNVVNIRAPGSDAYGDRHARSLLLRNRERYNQLMQRFRSLQQSRSQRAEYPESVRPRSPVHEENLNLARQYANHITERVGAPVLTGIGGPSQRVHENHSRSGIIRDSFLHQLHDRHGNRLSQSTIDARTEGERNRGWGRYQPSFFTNPAAAASNDSDNISNNRMTTGDLQSNTRPYSIRSARTQSGNRHSTPRMAPYAIRVPPRSIRPDRMRYTFDFSSSSRVPSSTSSSDDFEPNHHSDELEPDEFEILPVDQSESGTTNAAGNESSREFDRMSASEMAQRLERQLRQLRFELFHLTRRNMDINSAIMTLPSHGSSQPSSSVGAATTESSHSHRSAFRSAGSALSRSMFSRSGNNNNTSTTSSSSSTSSSILSSALSATSASSSSSSSYPLVLYSRSIPSISSVPYIYYSTSSGMTRSSVTNTNSSSTNLTTQTNNERRVVDNLSNPSISERQNLRVVPTTVTDNTSQTFGAMNLPEQLDRSTDMTGLDNEQCLRDAVVPIRNATENVVLTCEVGRTADGNPQLNGECDSSTVDSGSNSVGLAFGNGGCGNTSLLTEQQSSFLISTSASVCTTQTPVTTISSSCSLSACSVPSVGILRSALTASSSSSLIPPFSSSSSSSSHQNTTNGALNASSDNTASASTRGAEITSNPRHSSHSSTLNDQRVFRSIANLRRNLSNIMSERRMESQIHNREPNSVLTESSNSTDDLRRENLQTDLLEMESNTSSVGRTEVNDSVPVTSSVSGSSNSAIRTSISNLQRRVTDVLHNIRANRTRLGGSARVEEVEDRFLSQTSQILSQTTAYWTEFLGRSVMELNQRISELERRLETNQYLLSSSNPFSHQRPGRPQDALMSSLFRNRAGTSNTVDRPTEVDSSRRRDVSDDGPPRPPATAGDSQANVRQNARGQIQRNQLLLDFLVWRGSRDSQSQRSLSFGQTDPSDLPSPSPSVTSSSSQMSLQAPILSSTLSAAPMPSTSSSSSSPPPPRSVTIHPSRDEDSEEDNDDDEDEMMREREEQGNGMGRRRQTGNRDDNEGGGGGGDSRWLGLQNIHLHPDYSSSILDDTINRPNETMQHIMNRTIAGVLDREEQAVASNIIPQTHRIQRWKISDVVVPSISRVSANIVVEQCKLHNDASCDISKDGTTLATFVPSHRGFPDDNILGVFSLRKETFAQCLYTKSFGPNAISVSISPANHYVMVGLAARRYFLFSLSNKMVGQVYKLVREKAGEKSMEHITDMFHPRARGVQLHISVNFGRWLPGIGEGIVYGTNRGDLHFCRPGPRRVPEQDPSMSNYPSNLRRNGSVRSSIATQTTTVSIRKTASTQTQGDEDAAGPSGS